MLPICSGRMPLSHGKQFQPSLMARIDPIVGRKSATVARFDRTSWAGFSPAQVSIEHRATIMFNKHVKTAGGDRRSMRTRANGTHNGAARTATINVACGPLDSTFVIDLTTQRGVFRFSLNFLVHKRLCLCLPMVEWRRRCEVSLASIVTGRRRPTIPDRTTRSIASYPRHGVARRVTRLRRSQEVPLSVVPIQRTVNPPHCIQAAHVHLELPCTRYSDGHTTMREDIHSRIQALRSTQWSHSSQAGRGTMLLASVRCNQ